MITPHDYAKLLPYDQCAYELMLQERLTELKRLYTAISEEHTIVEMELTVLAWRKSAGKQAVKKVLLYEDFFKGVRKSPRQDKVGSGRSLEERQLLSELEF